MFKKLRALIMNLFYKEKRTVRDTSEKRSNFIGVVVSDKNDKNTLRVEQHVGFTRITDLPSKPLVNLNEDGTDPAVNTGYENRILITLDDKDQDPEEVIREASKNFDRAFPNIANRLVGESEKRDGGNCPLQLSISTEHSTPRDHMLGEPGLLRKQVAPSPVPITGRKVISPITPEDVVVLRAELPDLPGGEDCFDDSARSFEVRFRDLPFMIRKGMVRVGQAEQIFIPQGADPALVQEIREAIALAKGEGLQYTDVNGVVHQPEPIGDSLFASSALLPLEVDAVLCDKEYIARKQRFYEKELMQINLSTALTPETDIHISQVKKVKARLQEPSKNEKRKMSPRRIKKESKKVIKTTVGKNH